MREDKTQDELVEVSVNVSKKPKFVSLLGNRNFSALFLGGFISNLGSYFTSIAIIFLALSFTSHLTENEATQAVALMTTFTIAPMLLLGPIAGVLSDKFDRKKIMVFGDFLGAVSAFGLIFATQIWHLYIFALVNSSIRQFFFPAKSASIPRIVKQEQLLTANSFIQTSSNVARLIGPLLAGFLTAIFGFQIAFIIDGISYLISAGLIVSIRKNLRPPKKEERVSMRSMMVGLRDGFKLSFSDRIITFVIVLFAFVIFLIGFIDPLTVPFMSFEFGMNEQDFGLIMSFSAISGIIAAIILSIKGELKKKLTFMTIIVMVASLCLAFIAGAPYLPGGAVWLYVGFAFIGVVNVGFNVPFSTLLQTVVKNEHLGKVSGVIDLVINAASLLAATIAATLAGVIPTAIIFGIVSGSILIAGIIGYITIRALKLEDEAQEREASMNIEGEQEELKEKMEEQVEFAEKMQLTVDQIKADKMKSTQPTLD